MKYMVTWLRSAQNDLADIWNHAPDRRAVTDAADRIDRALEHDADQKGQPYYGIRRIYIDATLAVVFTPYSDDCRVFVIQVHRY
jgi:plasmid stabilization system protein ParE